MFQFAPLLWGAGLGALGGLITGKDPLKGALVGGATGGLLGAMPAGAWAGGAAEATKTAGMASIDPASGVGAFVDGASSAANIAADPLTDELLASRVPNMGAQAFTQQPSMFDQISPYLNVQDISGAAQVASQFQPQQRQVQPQSGQVSRGQAPEGNDVSSLLKSIRQPERKRITLL